MLIPLTPTFSELTGPRFQPEQVACVGDLTQGHKGEPLGERIWVSGRVLDDDAKPVPNTLIEVWQCNAAGRYLHAGDQHAAPLDPNFTGVGREFSDDQGRYRFKTIKPGAYLMAGLIPNARVDVTGAAAHAASVERPALVARLLIDHLHGHPDTSPQPDPERARRGELVRRAVLGDAHVDLTKANTSPLTAPFQDLITRYAWGEIWSRPGLSRAERSLVTLSVLAALHHDEELAMHVRAALRNGLDQSDAVSGNPLWARCRPCALMNACSCCEACHGFVLYLRYSRPRSNASHRGLSCERWLHEMRHDTCIDSSVPLIGNARRWDAVNVVSLTKTQAREGVSLAQRL